MSDETGRRKAAVAAWAGTTGLMAVQGMLARRMGGQQGFQTGLGGFFRSGARSAFRSTPWQVKLATGVMIGAGMLAKQPLQGLSNMAGMAKDTWDKT